MRPKSETIRNMMQQDKITVVWVDHDQSINDILQRLGNRSGLRERAPLSDSITFLPVVVDYALTPAERSASLADKVEREVRKVLANKVDMILVDLSYGPHLHPAEVENGWSIAAQLRQKLHPLPIGVYTRDNLSPTHRALISSDGFALLLENFGNMLERNEALDVETWIKVFRRAVSKAKESSSSFPTFQSYVNSGPQAVWASGHPKSTAPSLAKYGPVLVGMALAQIPSLKTVKMFQLGGGFSGSYLIKAEPQEGHKAFVIKIDEAPQRLRREFAGYTQMLGYISQRHVIKPEGEPVVLSKEFWGAIALEYDGKRKPLIDCEPLEADLLGKIYNSIWRDCLFKAYGTPEPHSVRSDSILKKKSGETVKSWIADWARYLDRARKSNLACWPWVASGEEWLGNVADEKCEGKLLSVPWVQRVHGDLNCRNVFYAPDDPAILLIDFPNVRPAPLATDFVKAEAELVIILMDRATGNDCELHRLNSWAALTEGFSKSLGAGAVVFGDAELQRISKPIEGIRKLYTEMSSAIGGDYEEAYRIALIARLLPYLAYPDVTPAKKILVLAWVGQLAGAKWPGTKCIG